jgi:PQQ-dependent catabolism-associated CXXCW motif protein
VRAAQCKRAVRSLLVGLVVIGKVSAGAQLPEPEGYRTEDYRSPTPDTLRGGKVLDTAAAHELWKDGNAVWIDVLPASRRPSNLPPSALWMPLPHRDIPGSLWIPDIGRGVLNDELETYFRDYLSAATKGRLDAPVVSIAWPTAG